MDTMLGQQHSKYDIQLLSELFKDRDSQSKGWLSKNQFMLLLPQSLRRSFPLVSEEYEFEDLLIVLSDSEENGAPSSYIHGFLRLLQQQQQQFEDEKAYEQAELIQKRCVKIRIDQYLRRERLLKETYNQKARVFDNTILQRLEEFEHRWDRHMEAFERQSQSVLHQTQVNHAKQRSKSSYTRLQSAIPDPKSSKELQMLKAKEKVLVKQKIYKQAGKVRDCLSVFKAKLVMQALQNQQELESQRFQNIRKGQCNLLQNLKDKISLERSKQMARRRQEGKNTLLRALLLAKDINAKLTSEEGIMTACLRQEFKIPPDNPKKPCSALKKWRSRFAQII